MNLKYGIIIPFSLLLLCTPSSRNALSDDKVSAVIAGIRGRYGDAKGLTAHYTREAISKTMAMLGVAERHDVAKGMLYFKPSHSLRLEQVSPQEELLLTDGQILWWYLPLKKEAYKYPSERYGHELRLLGDILKGLKGTEDSFQITLDAIAKVDTYHLNLKPEPPWQEIDHLEVIIRKGDFAIKQVEIYNNIGGLTRFLLSDWEEKDRFEPEFFSFSPPSGTKVIEQ